MSERPTWSEYFSDVARLIAKRSTCKRAQVGCVIVVDNQIVSTGYNGSLRGHPHCSAIGCDMDNGHCVRTVHAELNALLQLVAAGGMGLRGRKAEAYVTKMPCHNCNKALVQAGVELITVVSDK